MAFSSGGSKGPMADINVTPLVDVMLVLLIIFIVTAPIMTYPIEVALPQRVINPPPQVREPPPPIDLRINADGTVYWNNSPVNVADLQRKMEDEVQRDPTNQPEPISHRAGGIGAFLVACQYSRAFDLRAGHDRLLSLLRQLVTRNLVLVVQANPGQYSDGYRSSHCQATQATPWTPCSFCRNGFISKRSRNGRSNIQTRD